MPELISFLMVIFAGVFFSELFRRFHLPYVVSLIAAGMIIGPFGLDLFEFTPTIDLIGEVGLVFLMFMAGLEIRLPSLDKLRKEVGALVLANTIVPFIAGLVVAISFGYGLMAALMLGAIFVSSSIAIVIPTLEANGLLNSRLGHSIITTTMIGDILSLVLFSLIIQTIEPTSTLPLPLFYILIFIFLVILKFAILKVREMFPTREGKDLFEKELRLIFLILIGTVVFFELLGMHAIIAGFFVGLTLSESIKSKLLKEKIHAMSYGLFIPTFFIIIGSIIDFSVFSNLEGVSFLVLAVVLGSVLSKFISGFIGGRMVGFNEKQSKLIGAATTPQLSTTLAVAFLGVEFGLLDAQMIVAITALSIITTFIGPLLVNRYAEQLKGKE